MKNSLIVALILLLTGWNIYSSSADFKEKFDLADKNAVTSVED